MIYVLETIPSEPIKIGTAFRPEQRKLSLQSGNPNKLKIMMTFEGGHELENKIHKDLKAYKVEHTKEWFRRADEVFVYLAKYLNPKSEEHNGKEYIVLWRETEESKTEFCPFCGSRHQHGIGDGHRVSHCAPGEDIFTRQSDGKVFYQNNGYFVRTKNNKKHNSQ